jgi:hypothetical protein
MNILKKIRSYFSKEKITDESNRIILSLDEKLENPPLIKIIITDTSDDHSKKFGEMLFNINSGFYHSSIFELLMNMSKEDKDIKHFIETSLIHWAALIKDNTAKLLENKQNLKWQNQDIPMIMPMEFNKNAK